MFVSEPAPLHSVCRIMIHSQMRSVPEIYFSTYLSTGFCPASSPPSASAATSTSTPSASLPSVLLSSFPFFSPPSSELAHRKHLKYLGPWIKNQPTRPSNACSRGNLVQSKAEQIMSLRRNWCGNWISILPYS